MPQPIDPFSELGRVITAERIQQIADRTSLVAQRHIRHNVQEELLAAEQQVRETEEKSQHVEQDLRRRNPFAGRRHRRGQDAAQDDETRRKQHTVYTPDESTSVMDEPDDHEFDVTI